MSNVAVRYAPSPTGTPHIGNIRTALFNFLFARNEGGIFILRIEDTDRQRLIPQSKEDIKKSLKLLGINWDRYFEQSQRLSLYQRYLENLKSKGVVYQDDKAWRIKVPKQKKLKWNDLLHGEIEFLSDVIEDFVLVKSDGFPTYHFASVIDDHEMAISHVIRGDEWISSTPKHLLLYGAFSWVPPKFVHIPPILGPNKKKLSKREGAKSVIEYIDEGYLKEALVNFLALLGWSPQDDQEIFTLDELIAEFSVGRLNKNSPIFNIEKLNWFNQQWLRRLKPEEFDRKVQSRFPNMYPSNVTTTIAPLVQSRIGTILDFPKMADPFYKKPELPLDVIKAVPLSGATISNYAKKLETIPNWNPESFRSGTVQFAGENNVNTKDLYRSVGAATFGSLVTPPLPESVDVFGKEETIERLNELAKKKK